MKKMRSALLLIIIISLLAGCGVNQSPKSASRITAKDNLSPADLQELFEMNDILLTQQSTNFLDDKYDYVSVFTTENGDIVLVGDYPGTLLNRDVQMHRDNWDIIDLWGSKIGAQPAIFAEVIAHYGRPDQTYYRDFFTAKNLLVCYLSQEQMVTTEIQGQEVTVPQRNIDAIKKMRQIFWHDINALQEGTAQAEGNYFKAVAQYQYFCTPVSYQDKDTLYDSLLACQIQCTSLDKDIDLSSIDDITISLDAVDVDGGNLGFLGQSVGCLPNSPWEINLAPRIFVSTKAWAQAMYTVTITAGDISETLILK